MFSRAAEGVDEIQGAVGSGEGFKRVRPGLWVGFAAVGLGLRGWGLGFGLSSAFHWFLRRLGRAREISHVGSLFAIIIGRPLPFIPSGICRYFRGRTGHVSSMMVICLLDWGRES